MKIFKKVILGISIFFISLGVVSAERGKFVVQICNLVDSELPNTGELLAYDVNENGQLSGIIMQIRISHDYANDLIRALNVYLPPELDGTPINLPLSCKTEKGDRIYRILKEKSSRENFERGLLESFINLKKIRHILMPDLGNYSSEYSSESSPRGR